MVTLHAKNTLKNDIRSIEKRPNYWVFYNSINSPIILTGVGTEDTLEIDIPFFHRILDIELTQYNTGSAAEQKDKFNFRMSKEKDQDNSKLKKDYWRKTDRVNARYCAGFGSPFEVEPTTYLLGFEGIASNEFHIKLHIMKV